MLHLHMVYVSMQVLGANSEEKTQKVKCTISAVARATKPRHTTDPLGPCFHHDHTHFRNSVNLYAS